MNQQVKEIPSCFHCGNDCTDEIIEFDAHSFCCNGCSTVYQILSDKGMDRYYSMEQTPGTNMKNRWDQDKYDFLDNAEIQQKLLDFSEGGVSKISLALPAIHCTSCIWLLEHLHQINPAIIQVQVNFLKRTAMITWHTDELSLKDLVKLLTNIGYEPSISLQDLGKKDKVVDRSIYYKLGIAGFAFGNIMMLSFPEYLVGDGFIENKYKYLFNYLNWILALPVLLYSASDYFKSAWAGLKHGFVNIDLPISIGVIALFLRSSYEIFFDAGAGFMDSFTMLIFLLLVGKWYQSKTHQALSFDRDYKSYFPIAIGVEKPEGLVYESVQNINVGDVVQIRNQELLPADGVLISDFANVDYSFVSGESTPVKKEKGENLFAGGRQKGATISVAITKPVDQSYLTQLWNQDNFNRDRKLDKIMDKVSRRFTTVVLLVALFTFIGWYIVGDLTSALNASTAVLIIACPCALALAIPFTFGNTMRFMGRMGYYLKSAGVIESVAKVDTLVFDKTGTISHGDGLSVKLHTLGKPVAEETLSEIGSIVKNSTHPLSQSIFAKLKEASFTVEQYEEIPGKGMKALVNNQSYRIGSRNWIDTDFSFNGEAVSQVVVERNNEVIGVFTVEKTYRAGVKETIARLLRQFKLSLISGDNDQEEKVMKTWFQNSEMYFNQQPQDKQAYIEQLQSKGGHVAMLGDGLNDAGALMAADVGIAVADNVFQFTPACDVIADGKQLKQLDAFLTLSKKAVKIVYWSFGISLSYNIIGTAFAIMGKVTPLFAAILMPLSSFTVIAFTLLTTSIVSKTKKVD